MKLNLLSLVNVFISIAAVFLLALLGRDYLMSSYMPALPTSAGEPPEAAATPALRTPFKNYAEVVERGLFGPEVKLFRIDLTTGGSASGDVPFAVGPAPVNPGALLELIGTVASTTGESYAVFQHKDSHFQELFKRGEEVLEGWKLIRIGKLRALVAGPAGEFEFEIPVEARSEAPDKRSINRRVGRKPARAARRTESGKDRRKESSIIQQTDDNEWIIDQRALEETLSDMGKVLTDARFLPYSEGGELMGFRLSEVKPRGVFAMLGLKNGDVLVRVNEYVLDSPEKGIELLQALRGESSISLDIIRKGEPTSLSYQVR